MKTFDRTVASLCFEIDDLREQVAFWKQKYEQEVTEHIAESNQRLDDAKKGVANMLMFALAVKDDDKGNLVISKEDRKELSENLR